MKRTITLLFAAVMLAIGAKAQTTADTAKAKDHRQTVKQMPEFPGGWDKISTYLSENIQYPDSARKAGIQGIVIVKFVIDTDGSITDAVVFKSVGGGLDEEALRVVKGMPRWKPGTDDGKPVRVYYSLPISFRIER